MHVRNTLMRGSNEYYNILQHMLIKQNKNSKVDPFKSHFPSCKVGFTRVFITGCEHDEQLKSGVKKDRKFKINFK